MRLFLLLFVALSSVTEAAKYTQDFKNFIVQRRGQGVLDKLERPELNDFTAFGGKTSDGHNDKIVHQPVIIIHGIQNIASRFIAMIQFLQQHGYRTSEIYMTTWGGGPTLPFGADDMKCDYVKQIRTLIELVNSYTGRKVDIIAYSMGSPLTRKAIMGGKCVENGEELGPQLTHLVDTYLSVAGANQGSYLCGIPWPGTTCNQKTGLFCGSEFINDINSRHNYEGAHIFSLFSLQDDKVGDISCGKRLAAIDGSHHVVRGGQHDPLMDNTKQEQFNIITAHHE